MLRLSAVRYSLPLISSFQQNWIKGILILLVIADHNNYYRLISEDFFRPFTFHVTGFFVLAFSGACNSKTPFKYFIFERLIRYGWPFLVFYSLYALGSKLTGVASITSYSYSMGLLIGSYELVKQGGGGAFLWFLPALLGFTLVIKLVFELSERFLVSLFIFSCVFHIFTAHVPGILKIYVPFGINITIYLIPIIIIFYYLLLFHPLQLIYNSYLGIFIFAVLAALNYLVLTQGRINIEIGSLSVPGIERYGLIVSNILTNLFSLLFIWTLAEKANGKNGLHRVLRSIGKHSLPIYLLHPFFFVVAYGLIAKAGAQVTEASIWFAALAVYAFALLSAWFAALSLAKLPRLSACLFPKDFHHLYSGLFGKAF